jgi:hypothetical protein
VHVFYAAYLSRVAAVFAQFAFMQRLSAFVVSYELHTIAGIGLCAFVHAVPEIASDDCSENGCRAVGAALDEEILSLIGLVDFSISARADGRTGWWKGEGIGGCGSGRWTSRSVYQWLVNCRWTRSTAAGILDGLG